jgi:monoterpene epsilon-lactone hydrolase
VARVSPIRQNGKSDHALRSCTIGTTNRATRAILLTVGEGGHLLQFPQAPDGIELRHLRAFVAVSEELNFGRAAERLFVSPPALSRQISGLEQLIGCKLLRRSTHRVELTVAGEALLDRARQVLRDVDASVAAAMSASGDLLARVTRLWEPMAGRLSHDSDLHEARALTEEFLAQTSPPPGTTVRPVTAGGVSSLLVAPGAGQEPTILYLHGGAYVLASAFGYQASAGALATAAQTAILVPDYRLAPEHPFPAAVEDALSAYQWLLDRGIAPERVTLAGDSSGGGLALSLLLTLKQQRAPLPGATVLLCPWVDLALQLTSDRREATAPFAATDDIRHCADMYLAGHPPGDPILDPLAADLSGLPRMLIQAATGDAWLADAKAVASRACDHGVDVRLELYPVDAHAFHLFWSFLPEAADAIEAAGSFIRQTDSVASQPAKRGA